ncbi:MAG: phosphatase [Bacteroidetes bacterium]|nr:phosphatase [Bacteroidota bacterium]
MRLAVIDCGTNTFNLLVIDLLHGVYTKIYSTRISVKLGEETINKGFIAEVPFNRGLEAIKTFRQEIKKYEAEKVFALGTAAIRDAKNGTDFVKQVKEQYDIDITVIDGNREAEFIYFGVREAVKLTDEISLLMDIGGGSNEFILANKQTVFWKQSFRIGAARLLEKFPASNPITKHETDNINAYLTSQLQPLFEAVKKFPPVELVGSSGAFDSVIEMINGELNGEPLVDTKTEYNINLNDYSKIYQLAVNSTVEQRKKIKGLVPMRFDMIVISCLMIDFILNNLHLTRLRASTYSLKEGALIDFINQSSSNYQIN